jgi:hypothetical protein
MSKKENPLPVRAEGWNQGFINQYLKNTDTADNDQ